jgi:hypothetical protein
MGGVPSFIGVKKLCVLIQERLSVFFPTYLAIFFFLLIVEKCISSIGPGHTLKINQNKQTCSVMQPFVYH